MSHLGWITVTELQDWLAEYDTKMGRYPESEYEGKAVAAFIDKKIEALAKAKLGIEKTHGVG